MSRPNPADYPNRLAEPEPQPNRVAWRPWLLLGLVALCFVPRAMMSERIPAVCPDATQYIRVAEALEQGNWQEGLRQFRLNPFTLVLAGMHQLGVEWETAGKWWGVAMASLVVLPLFGWARRVFDDRVAVVACVLYAVHAKFIEWSPEIIRDPTFWPLLMLSVYLLWRGITEVRPGILMAAGVATGLAALTRFEGFFLIIPFALWSASRWLALRQRRFTLAIGLLLGLFAPIGLLLLINFAWLGQHAPWGLVRTSPLVQAEAWLRSLCNAAAETGGGHSPMPWGRMLAIYSMNVVRGLTAVHGVLMLVGLWQCRRILTRRDQLPGICLALAIFASMWMDLECTHISSTRYVLPIVLLGSPLAALGLLALAERLRAVAARRSARQGWRRVAWASPLVLVAVVGVTQGLRDRYDDRNTHAELGRWTRREFGDQPVLAGHSGLGSVAAYYAGGSFAPVSPDSDASRIADVVGRAKPDVVVLSVKELGPERNPQVCSRMQRLGFEPLDPAELPSGSRRILVWVRGRSDLRTACQSAGKSKSAEKGSAKL